MIGGGGNRALNSEHAPKTGKRKVSPYYLALGRLVKARAFGMTPWTPAA